MVVIRPSQGAQSVNGAPPVTSLDVEPRSDGLLGEILIARQPILDPHLSVVGHELLYRDASGAAPDRPEDGIRETATILIDGVIGLGRDLLADGDEAFINVPSPLLRDGCLLDLPPKGLVLEVVDDTRDLDGLWEAIRAHRGAGFKVALDGIVPGDPRLDLADAVDLVKVDVLRSGETVALQLIRDLARRGISVCAEKVEEPASFDRVIGAGATLVQGFFFTRPRAVRSTRPLGLSSVHFELLRACTRDEVDLEELDALIRSDLTLADRFLSVICAATSRWGELTSVRQGLLMLGSRAVHRWVRLLILSSLVRDEHPELMILASVRGRYCEALEQRHGTGRGLEAFAAGMFSVLGRDAVVSEPALSQLPINEDVRAALAGEENHFRVLLDIQLAAENADWPTLVRLGGQLGFSNSALAAAHVDALTWAKQLSGLTEPESVVLPSAG